MWGAWLTSGWPEACLTKSIGYLFDWKNQNQGKLVLLKWCTVSSLHYSVKVKTNNLHSVLKESFGVCKNYMASSLSQKVKPSTGWQTACFSDLLWLSAQRQPKDSVYVHSETVTAAALRRPRGLAGGSLGGEKCGWIDSRHCLNPPNLPPSSSTGRWRMRRKRPPADRMGQCACSYFLSAFNIDTTTAKESTDLQMSLTHH